MTKLIDNVIARQKY